MITKDFEKIINSKWWSHNNIQDFTKFNFKIIINSIKKLVDMVMATFKETSISYDNTTMHALVALAKAKQYFPYLFDKKQL